MASRSARSVDDGGDRLDLDERILVAEHGDAENRGSPAVGSAERLLSSPMPRSGDPPKSGRITANSSCTGQIA
jgi:hypothetical protein